MQEITDGIHIIKFDDENSKYNTYIETIPIKITNITDKEIIEFYDIDVLPTLYIYKIKT